MLHWLYSSTLVTLVIFHVTLVTLLSLISGFTAVQTGPINVMTLFAINTLTTLLPTVLTKCTAITLCRKLKTKQNMNQRRGNIANVLIMFRNIWYSLLNVLILHKHVSILLENQLFNYFHNFIVEKLIYSISLFTWI